MRKINDSVYEVHRTPGKWDCELILFHGLCFSEHEKAYKTTWEVEGGSGWWLTNLFSRQGTNSVNEPIKGRVLSISYDSCAQRSDKTGRVDFNSIGRTLVQDIIHLAKAGQQGCPVILIGYCLGGLVIKQLCTEAGRQLDQAQDGSSKGRLDRFLTNVRGIAYLDTPHAGSGLVDFLKREKKCDGPVLEYLNKSSERLVQLNGEFHSIVFEREWKQRDVRASHSTEVWSGIVLPVQFEIVPEESSRQGGVKMPLSVSADHSTMHKVDTTKQYIKGFILDVLGEPRSSFIELPGNPFEDAVVERSTSASKPRGQPVRLNDSLYEVYRPAENDFTMEIIFFPGLHPVGSRGAYLWSWMSVGEESWLQTWLPEEFPTARIMFVQYESVTSSDQVESLDFYIMAENLMTIIKSPLPTRRPIILVGHCFGGLVIKELCQFAEKKAGSDIALASEGFLSNILGIAYLSTPHAGYVECKSNSPRWWWFGSAGESSRDHEKFWLDVARVNSDHNRRKATLGWKELALFATFPTEKGGAMIVSDASASRGIHHNFVFAVAADHFTICKPNRRESNSFQYLVHFIRTAMDEAQYPNMNVRRKKYRGVAMIIAMEEQRKGSENDRNRLEVLLGVLGFKTLTVVCREASEILQNIGDILEEEVNEQDESFLCIVNAHGGVSPKTPGADGEKLSAVQGGVHFIFHLVNDEPEELLPVVSGILEPIAACKKLVGKPKVIVINACRTELGPEILVEYSEKRDGGHPIECDPVRFGRDDCLLMYSAQLNAKSWRQSSIESGTLCLLEMVSQLTWAYQTADVQEIFKEVAKQVQARARILQKDVEKKANNKRKLLDELLNMQEEPLDELKGLKEEEVEELEKQIQKLEDDIKYLNRDGQLPVIEDTLKKRLSWRPR